MKSDPTTLLEIGRLRAHLARRRVALTVIFCIAALAVAFDISNRLNVFILTYPFLLFPDPIYAAHIFSYGVTLIAIIAFAIFTLFTFRNHWLHCPHCNSRTEIKHTWVCGMCHKEHLLWRIFWKYSFLETCARCGKVPHSLICFQCREPIIFDKNAFAPETSAWLPGCPPVALTAPEKPLERPRPIDEDLR
jgi:hypothetical protein